MPHPGCCRSNIGCDSTSRSHSPRGRPRCPIPEQRGHSTIREDGPSHSQPDFQSVATPGRPYRFFDFNMRKAGSGQEGMPIALAFGSTCDRVVASAPRMRLSPKTGVRQIGSVVTLGGAALRVTEELVRGLEVMICSTASNETQLTSCPSQFSRLSQRRARAFGGE